MAGKRLYMREIQCGSEEVDQTQRIGVERVAYTERHRNSMNNYVLCSYRIVYVSKA